MMVDPPPMVLRSRQALFEHCVSGGVKTDDDLHAFIRIFLGYNVPRQVCCPHHTPPFSFIADQFFERSNYVIGFANRTGGKTLNTSILNACEGLLKGKLEIVASSAVKQQTERGYGYTVDLITQDPLIQQMLVYNSRKETIFRNRSKIEITPATFAGFNSPHPQKLRIDEIEMVHWDVMQQAFSMPMSSDDWSAGICLTSTRKVMSGTMQKMLDQADKRGFKTYCWCIFDVMERCTRECFNDPVHGDCPLYSFKDMLGNDKIVCGGKAHDLPEGNGFYKVQDFIDRAKTMDHETVEAEWLNEKPSAGKTVYARFYIDEPPFIVQPEEEQKILRAAESQNWPRVAGMDFGSNFCVEFLTFDPYTETWYVYGEYWSPSDQHMTLENHATHLHAYDPLGWSNRTIIYADPSRPDSIADLKGMSAGKYIFTYPASNAIESGINYVKTLLGSALGTRRQPGLRIFQVCKRLRDEMASLYVYFEDKKGDIQRDKPVKKDNHACDALRYALYSYESQNQKNTVNERRLEGVW